VDLGIGKPLVFGEVEVNPKLLQVFRLACLNFNQVLQQGFVPLFDLLAQDIAVCEYFEPKFRNGFIGKVIVLVLLFLLGEQLTNLLEINISEGMLTRNNIVDLIGKRDKSVSEFALNGFDFSLKLLINFSLLDEISVDSNCLDLLLKSGESLDFLFNLFLNIDLKSTKKYFIVFTLSTAILLAILWAVFNFLL
jgi:hypothetical protein